MKLLAIALNFFLIVWEWMLEKQRDPKSEVRAWLESNQNIPCSVWKNGVDSNSIICVECQRNYIVLSFVQ